MLTQLTHALPDSARPVNSLRRPAPQRLASSVLAMAMVLSLAGPGTAWAQRDEGGNRAERQDRGERADRRERSERGDRGDRGDRNDRGERAQRQARADHDRSAGPAQRHAPAPHINHGARPDRGRGSWYDGAHGHNHHYPAPGHVVRVLPPASRAVYWGGAGYRYGSGIWYSSGPHGWVVVRPPYGVRVHDLPAFATVLTIAGMAYLYSNGVYYRHHGNEGYEVVPPPVQAATTAAESSNFFVYPRQGQSAAQQASDEYECHRWAFQQTGYDPTGAAIGQAAGAPGSKSVTLTTSNPRGDYDRARLACLDGRGYTVR